MPFDMKQESVTMFPQCVHIFYHNMEATMALSVYVYSTYYNIVVVVADCTYTKTYSKDMAGLIELTNDKLKELQDDTILTGECVAH